jgi:hypothetical protein
MEEEWKVIEDSPNYSVSSFGRFRNNRNGKILKQSIHRNKGYCWVTLTSISSGKRKAYQAHSLVAKYFCQNKHNYIEVNHIDGDKTNNHPQNLEWVTRSENLKHAYKLGLRPRKTKATESNKKKCFVKIKETDEILEFESMTQASYYFNKEQTWACGVVKRGGETKKYKVWQFAKEVENDTEV